MKIDKTGRVIQFCEKPKGADLEAMVSWYFSSSLYRTSANLSELTHFKWLIVESGHKDS